MIVAAPPSHSEKRLCLFEIYTYGMSEPSTARLLQGARSRPSYVYYSETAGVGMIYAGCKDCAMMGGEGGTN
jgi:hypothetical protein